MNKDYKKNEKGCILKKPPYDYHIVSIVIIGGFLMNKIKESNTKAV